VEMAMDMEIENKKIMCPTCNKGFLEDETSDYDTVVKDGAQKISITVKNLKREKCPHCKEEFLGPVALDRIQNEKYRTLDLLTPEQLKNIRKRLKFTQEEMSDLLCVGKKSYLRWERGLSIQNRSIDRYIRLVNENSTNVLFLKDLQHLNKENAYDKEKVAEYITNLESIEQHDEEFVAQVGHDVEIPNELREKVEEVIKKHLEEHTDEQKNRR